MGNTVRQKTVRREEGPGGAREHGPRPADGGLRSRDVTAPSYEQLRPFNRDRPATGGFPVHPGLVDLLAGAEDHPDETVAHALAVCSGYAYSEAETVSMIMARLGLEDNHCRMVTASVDAMFIESTAFLVQSNDGRVVVLCYRGTEVANFVNWLTAADTEPERISYQFGDPCASVHAGFYRNVRSTRHEVMEALDRAVRGLSVRKPPDGRPAERTGRLEALYITGHSLGGAMAALTAAMLRHEEKYAEIAARLRAVYTIGQPMVGDSLFAGACENDGFLRDRVVRYVYDSDPVPHLPPTTSGPFRHFGREYHYGVPHLEETVRGWLRYAGCAYRPRRGRWERRPRPASQMPNALGMALGASAFVARKSQPLRALPFVYSFENHLPQRYITALTPRGVTDEFGD